MPSDIPGAPSFPEFQTVTLVSVNKSIIFVVASVAAATVSTSKGVTETQTHSNTVIIV